MTDETSTVEPADEQGEPPHVKSLRYITLEQQYSALLNPTAEQALAIGRLRGAILDVAWIIETNLAEGRDKSLAFTLLEDLQLRANHGILRSRTRP